MKLFISIFILLFGQLALAQQDCASAIQIDGQSTGCFVVDMDAALFDNMNGTCVPGGSEDNNWFYFIADGPELNIIANHEDGLDVYISIIRFTGVLCDPVKKTEIGCGINEYYAQNVLEVGKQYYVVINVESNLGGNVTLCVTNPDITPPPINDLPCQAIELIPDSTCVIGTTVYAEQDMFNFPCEPSYTNDVWYKFTTGNNLIFGVQIFGAPIGLTGNLRVALIEFGNGGCEAEFIIKDQYCGPGGGFLFDYVNLEPDKQYYISVSTDPNEAGEFSLCIQQMQALSHTDPCQALFVTPNEACYKLNTYYSVFQYDLPNCEFTNQKLWYQFFTGNDLDAIKVNLKKLVGQENVFLGIGYFQGNWCQNQFTWEESFCGLTNEAEVNLDNLLPNQLYHIVVGTNYGFTGEFELCINGDYKSPYTNGTACTAYNIEDFSGCVGGSSQYGTQHIDDTLCFGITPLISTWYKVELEKYNHAIDVEFSQISDIPVHRIQMGYFENGCFDTYTVTNDFCQAVGNSSISYSYPDSIKYAYISVSLPTDRVYNYSICVNPIDLGISCISDDFCEDVISKGTIFEQNELCFEVCTFGNTRENTDEFYTSRYPTSWYKMEVGDNVNELIINFYDSTNPSAFIGLYEAGSCVYDSFEVSRYLQLTESNQTRITVIPNKTYMLACAFVSINGGKSDICITGVNSNVCAINDEISVKSTSLGSPFEGPFQEGEIVNFCYKIENFDIVNEASCQWLQGIIPVFGDSWDVSSFNVNGMPNVTKMIASISNDVSWAWLDNVHSGINNENRKLFINNQDKLSLCHVNSDDCIGNVISIDDTLPAGWFAWNFSQGGIHPDNTYGDGLACDAIQGPWEICFDLKVGSISNNTDLSVSMHTFADGEIGTVNLTDSSCDSQLPSKRNFYIDCNIAPLDSSLTFLTCSGNDLALNLPENQFYYWYYLNNPRVEGESAGSASSVNMNLTTDLDVTTSVRYFIQAYSPSGCHLTNYTVDVIVYPSLDIDREPLFTICLNDSVQMTEIIDLSSQIIGDFEVNWNTNKLENTIDDFLLGDYSDIIVYSVISEAGCTFSDSLFIHVEDVIVSEFVVPYVVCKNDVLNLSTVIDLENIISDPFSVDWDYGLLEDVPNADTSFLESTVIPFTITGLTGCTYEDELEINVPFVNINILGKNEYCSSDTISISAGYSFNLPHDRYWILPNGNNINSAGLAIPANQFNSGLNYFEFRLFTEEGCPFYDFDTIEIFQVPEFEFNQVETDLGICPYDSIILNVEVTPSFYGVQWETPNGMSEELSIILKDAGNYKITAGHKSSSISCLNSEDFTLEIYPAVSTTFSYDPIICIGDSTLIESFVTTYKYVWSTGNFSSAELLPPGEYSVTVSNAPGCIQTFDFNIEERMLPNPNFDYLETLCEGDSTWIIGSTLYEYSWSTSEDSSSLLSFGGNYEVTVTDDEMCVDSFKIDIEVLPYPIVDFSAVSNQDTLFLTNLSTTSESCLWMINDDLVEGIDTFLILQVGDYEIGLTCYNGDCGDFETQNITISLTSIVNNPITKWTLFPNPNNGQFVVILDDKIDHGALSIIDVKGKILKNIPFSPNQQKVEISTELIPGIYFMKLQSLKHSDMKRFIIIE